MKTGIMNFRFKESFVTGAKSAGQVFIVAFALLTMPGCKQDKNKSGPFSSAKQGTNQPRELKKAVLQSKSGEASFEEMEAQVQEDTQKGRYTSAAQWIEKIIRRYPEADNIVDYRYKLAESYFMAKKYLVASEAYLGFARLYPNDEREHDARFLALTAKYNYSKGMSIECDSTETRDVMGMCQAMLSDESMADKHTEIASIMKHCDERLLNKEVTIFDSYLRRGKHDAAKKRLEKVKSEYLTKNEELEPRVIFLECKLAKSSENEEKANELLEALTEKHPESKFTRMASGYMNAGAISDFVFG